MAIINCPECKKEISDKALSCPGCGCPMEKIINIIEFPEIPKETNIGKRISPLSLDTGFQGLYNQSENALKIFDSGNLNIAIHTHGVSITQGLKETCIHLSQIISIEQISQEELVNKSKSVVGRGIVGGVVLGPIGAIVGGMSGIGTKQKIENKHYLVLNFWDIATKSKQTLLINSTWASISIFIERQKKEAKITKETGRIAEKYIKKINYWPLIFFLVVTAIILFAFFS